MRHRFTPHVARTCHRWCTAEHALRCALVAIVAVTVAHGSDSAVETPHHNIVLLGCNGDLAKKYLWRAFFELFLTENAGATFSFYCCGRSPVEEGRIALQQTVKRISSCPENDTYCAEAADAFRAVTDYLPLVTPADYARLGELLASGSRAAHERSRWFYLAIPPRDYGSVSELIAKHCRPLPASAGTTRLKVIFEKPFGRDLASVAALAVQLQEHFQEDEMYRIDHYLGKPAVRAILPFRLQTGLERYWSSDFIERIEIVLSESDGVTGRMSFYDDYGAVRDMLQNHATEVLLLLTMEMPSRLMPLSAVVVDDVDEQLRRSKLDVLSTLSVDATSAVVQQYDGYLTELLRETGRNASATPTFASFDAFVRSRRWRDVPVRMAAGKKMASSCKYAKVVFRPGAFNAQPIECSPVSEPPRPVVSFNLGCDGLASASEPLVVASADVAARINISAQLLLPLHVTSGTDAAGNVVWNAAAANGCGANGRSCDRSTLDSRPSRAYDVLVGEIYRGLRRSFIGTDHLLSSWRLWSPVIERLENQTLVSSASAVGQSDASNRPGRSAFVAGAFPDTAWSVPVSEADELARIVASMSGALPGDDGGALPGIFLGRPLLSGSSNDVTRSLVRTFVTAVRAALLDDGRTAADAEPAVVNVALSGGRSPIAFLHALTTDASADVRWERVHIWLVDERCVPSDDEASNFRLLQRHLLDRISALPAANVHPVVLEVRDGSDGGATGADDCRWAAELYDARLRRLLRAHRRTFDFVLLGLGEDGHTASLFPDHSALHEALTADFDHDDDDAGGSSNGRLAVYVTLPEVAVSAAWRPPVSRVTLTLAAISRARSVAILAMGSGKHQAVHRLQSGACNGPSDCPVLGILQRNRSTAPDSLQWFIDDEALYGDRVGGG